MILLSSILRKSSNLRLSTSIIPIRVSRCRHSDRKASITKHPVQDSLPVILVNKAPESVRPYLRLMRVDRPIGSWLLFWPSGWSLALATPAGSFPDIRITALFAVGAFVMRGAGCTINDMWDRDIDRLVTRTKDRPLTSGSVSFPDCLAFLSLQLSVGLNVLLQLNFESVLLGASSLGLVAIYPVMKRITHWPQLFLGLTFNWGALLGWCAVTGTVNWAACLPLYAAGVSWTLIYDTIYAHQDKYDDISLGIKSTALKFGDSTKSWLTLFSISMISCLSTAGIVTDQTWPYYGAVAITGLHLGRQISTLDIDNAQDCAKKFVSNKRIGLFLFLGIMCSTYLKSPEVVSLPLLSI